MTHFTHSLMCARWVHTSASESKLASKKEAMLEKPNDDPLGGENDGPIAFMAIIADFPGPPAVSRLN